ncbi:winged helix DNA-binding domain-containing protein [Nonomuraea mangrovi]|uniref:Winged helix DNA-binding domain-containing protein n=1 Tax=Nonomuraea mangrovi TaxID=2316207 RepID=A0ABW4ST31_9ACTN
MISQRALNRATLARQLLLRRHAMSPTEVIEHLVGLQAQAPFPPYFGLWSRMTSFQPKELAELLVGRQVVRITLMRGTVHLVSARDCLAIRPLIQPMLTRALTARRVDGIDHAAVVAAGRALLTERPLSVKAMTPLLAERFPDAPPADLPVILRWLLPMVQLPPRGVWGKAGDAVLTPVEAWLGRDLDPEPAVEHLLRRYLAAFGPATVADMQAWSGLTGLRAAAAKLDLVDLGGGLLDLRDAPRPDEDTPAPVRLVAPFDNLVLGHADRTRVIADEHRKRVITINGQVHGTVLVDGYVHGIWKRDRATVTVSPFGALTTAQREEIEAEAVDLLAFAEPGKRPTVRFD